MGKSKALLKITKFVQNQAGFSNTPTPGLVNCYLEQQLMCQLVGQLV